MDKKDLIDEIRELEYNQEGADKYKISSLSDEQLIFNFIKCTCCDHIPVEDEDDIESAIRIAHNAEQFFIVCSFIEELRYEEYGEGDEDEEEYEEED